MRHAQLVTSRDAWLEDATRQAMVASSEAIAVQWDLEATALIADAESAIIPSFGVATPDLAALVDQATSSSTLDDLIARADTLQSRARDTNVVVAAYLPTVNTRATEASTARAVTADLFDQVTERAAVLAAIQAREQFTAQQEGMESGIRDANDSVAYNLSDQMAGAGYRRSGATWRRRMPIGDTLFGGTEYETHEVAAYRNFISPGFRSSVDLSDAALVGLSGQAIFTLVNEATEEMNRYQVLVFGRSDEQKRQGDNRFVQAASAAEFTDSLSVLLSDAQTAWRSGAGYRQHEHKDTEGLFNFHVGYAPVIDRDNPERIGQAGYGQLGRIMGAFMVNEARAQRGYAAITTPAYRKPLWDDDKDNDGNSDGLFGAPTIASVVDIGVTVALTASGMGAPLVAALSLVDDAVFAAADVSTGYQSAGAAFKQLGIKAATSAATMGIQHLGSMADAAITTGSKLLEVGTDLAIKAAEMTTTNATIAVLNNGFDGDAVWNATFGRDAMRQYTVGLVDTLVDSSLQTGIFGTTGGDLANARALSGLAGGLSGAAVEYGLTGSTKFNVLNLGDFTGGEHSLGLLELNIGGNQSMFNLGTGGVGISSSQLRQAYAGFEVFQASREIGQQGFVGEEAIAMRMLRSLGEDETSQLFDDLMTGKASIEDLATSGIRARTELNEQNGRDIHVNADELDDGPFALAITLAHEAFRDGVVTDEASQRAETTAAVLGHVDAARALMAGYGNLSVSREQRREVEVVTMLQAIERQTGTSGLVEQYANSAYDSSADYWRLTEDGGLVATEDGYLKTPDGEYIRDIHGNKIGAEDAAEGLTIIAGLVQGLDITNNQAAQMMAAAGITDSGEGVIGADSLQGTEFAQYGSDLQNGLFNRLLNYQEDWTQAQAAAYGELFQNPEQFQTAEANFARVMMLANVNDEVWAAGGYADYLERNLVQMTIGGQTLWTHQNAAAAMNGLSNHLTEQQLSDLFATSVGSFVPRTARGMNGSLSTHALGLSIDFDPLGNPMYRLPATGQNADVHERAIALFEAAASSHGGMGKTNYAGHIEAVKALQTAQSLGGIDGFVNEYLYVQNTLNQSDVLSNQALAQYQFLQDHAGLYAYVSALNPDPSSPDYNHYLAVGEMLSEGIVNHSPIVMEAFRNIGMPMLTWDTRPWNPWVGVDGMHFELIDYGL